MELLEQDVDLEKGEEEMGGGKRRRKAKRFEDEDGNDKEDVHEEGFIDENWEKVDEMR